MGMIREYIKVRVTLTEEMLGMCNSNPNMHEAYIASKAPDASTMKDEIEALGVQGVVEKGRTIFPKLPDGTPFLWDYQIKGAFKEACSMLRLAARGSGFENESSKLTSNRKIIDGLIMVSPRKIPLIIPEGETMDSCQRRLRTSGPSGERIALADSETVPEGTEFEFTVALMNEEHEAAVLEWMEYWTIHGLGQWRNSGKGTAVYDILNIVKLFDEKEKTTSKKTKKSKAAAEA